jgi:hypothetical protein
MKMNKKILLFSIVSVFMLVAISYAAAINTTNTEKKDSPLYRIRTKRAITEKISEIIENIKTRFLGNRIFFLPLQRLKNKPRGFLCDEKTSDDTCDCYSSDPSVYCKCEPY